MNFAQIHISPENVELNHFSHENNNNEFAQTRFITFEGMPTYGENQKSDYHIDVNGKLHEMPGFVSVIIRDNYAAENLKQCKYFEDFSDKEYGIRESSFEVVVDYEKPQFNEIWEMISRCKTDELKFEVFVKLETKGSWPNEVILLNEENTFDLSSVLFSVYKSSA